LLASVASPALADDLTISSVVTSSVATSHAANGTPGNISIAIGGGVSVVTAGAAVTLDSNNTVDNIGVIQNAFATGGAVGVHIVGGNTGTFTNEGGSTSIINVGGGGDANTGVLLDGPAAFNGDILLGEAGTLFVNGNGSNGIAIRAPLNGNLTNGASTSASGVGANGILVLAPISGALSSTFAISAAGTATYTVTDIDPLSGSAIAVGASISGGILNAGPAVDNDGITSSSLIAVGSVPALAIQPSVAGASASNIAIGILADTVNPNLSFINRGTVRATENDPGISTIGVGIGELGTAAHTVTLAGGIYNRGSIQAQSESDNNFATSAAAARADATALLIGNGAVINASGLSSEALLNGGSIVAAETGSLPSISTGILIQPGGSLPSVTNTGLISATISTSDTTIASLTAYGIHDLSGTLTTVVNSGQLNVQSSALDNGAQKTIAADLSHTSANERFTDSGTVTGDILFGSAGLSGGVAGNQLVIEGAAAIVQGAVAAAANGTVDVHVSESGTGGALRTPTAQITSLTVGSGGTVELALNKTSTTAPVITATGAVTFGTGSKVTVTPSSFLPNSGTYTLIHSGGALQFSDFAAATAQPIPFIFNGAVTHDNNNLVLTIQRKTAAELGLTANLAAIYDPLAVAALGDNEFGAALLTLGSATEVESVVSTAVPDVAGAVRALSIAMTDQATGVIGARERSLVTAPPNTRNDFRFWGQEFYNNVSASSTATTAGYGGAGQGVAVGVEWGSFGTGRYGLGYTFFSSEETETHPRDTKTNGDWNMVTFYGGWRSGDFFVTPQLNLGEGSFHSRRSIVAATVTRSATAAWSSYIGAGGLTTGYIVDAGGFQIIPELSLDGLYLRESAYNEAGAGGIGLSLKPQNQNSVRTFAGVLGQGNYLWDTGTLQPQLLVGWSHEFLNTPATIDGSFESTPGSPFHLVGPTLEPNKIIGGASFAYVVGNWSAGINYDAAASTGTLAQSATISLSSRF
jgi:hypothetical protein